MLDAGSSTELNSRMQSNGSESKRTQLAVLSANTQESLKAYIEHMQEYVARGSVNTEDLVYTLSRRREHLPHRAFMVIDGAGAIVESSAPAKVPANNPDTVMVFSGQGAQWPGMGKDLFLSDTGFRADIKEMDRCLKSLSHPPTWSIEGKVELVIPKWHHG